MPNYKKRSVAINAELYDLMKGLAAFHELPIGATIENYLLDSLVFHEIPLSKGLQCLNQTIE
jgi:hypothetical protein